MFAEVEAFAFDLCRDAPTGDRFGDAEGDGRTDRRPEDGDADRLELDDQLSAENIVVASRAAECGKHGDRGQDRTDQAADAVDAEHVERVVEAELRLELHHEPAADDTRDGAEQDRAERTRVTGSGCDRNKTGD